MSRAPPSIRSPRRKFEDLIRELEAELHDRHRDSQHAAGARISDITAFFYLGELIEFGETCGLFNHPTEKRTEDYITGRFG